MRALAVVVKPKQPDPYCIPKPEKWDFRDEDHAENGEYIVVKVKSDGDNKLEITEIEGIPVGDDVQSDPGNSTSKTPSVSDVMDTSDDGDETSNDES